MLTELEQQAFKWHFGGESIILLLCAPFLLFPTQLPLATTGALLLLLILWLHPLLGRKKTTLLLASPINIALLLWGLTFLVSILVTADPLLTLSKTTGLLLGLTVWLFLLRHARVRSVFTIAVWGFILLGIGLTLVGIFSANWLFKVAPIAALLEQLSLQFIVFPESPTVGTHTNQLAATIIMFWPLLLSLLIGRRWLEWPKFIWLAVVTTAVFTTGILILTQSRSSWVAALISLGVILFLWSYLSPASSQRRSLRSLLGVLIISLFVAVMLIGPRELQTWWLEPPGDSIVGSLSSLNLRQEIWPWALTAIHDFPFTGVGLGAFRQVGPRLYPLSLPADYDIGHAHNIFLQVALDFGLIGLVAYMGVLFASGAMAWQILRQDAQKRPFAIGLLASLIALHIFGLADTLAPGAKPGILFWYNIGLITSLFHQQPRQKLL